MTRGNLEDRGSRTIPPQLGVGSRTHHRLGTNKTKGGLVIVDGEGTLSDLSPNHAAFSQKPIIKGDKHEYRRGATTYLSQHVSNSQKSRPAPNRNQRVMAQPFPRLGTPQPNVGSAQTNLRGTWSLARCGRVVRHDDSDPSALNSLGLIPPIRAFTGPGGDPMTSWTGSGNR